MTILQKVDSVAFGGLGSTVDVKLLTQVCNEDVILRLQLAFIQVKNLCMNCGEYRSCLGECVQDGKPKN